MDTMKINKVIAAVLCAGIAFELATLISHGFVHHGELKQTAVKVEGAPESGGAAAGKTESAPQIAPLLASADPAKGEAIMKKDCAICHQWTKGGQTVVGPPLWGVVGRERASVAGFDYSDALKSKKGKWTYQTLSEWLTKPDAFAPGTKMTFPGIANIQQRADVIAFLRTQSDNPEPLPKAEAAAKTEQPKAAEAAPAAGAAAAANGGFVKLVAASTPAEGEAVMKKKGCGLCHDWNKGGAIKVGPPLYGVVGRERASYPGFDYSDALKAKKGKWTYDTLNEWLTKPSAFAPGTKMIFPGISSEKERAEVVAFLRTQSEHPEPLPAAAGGAAAEPAKTAAPAPEANKPAEAKPEENKSGQAPAAAPSQEAAPAPGNNEQPAPAEQNKSEQAPAAAPSQEAAPAPGNSEQPAPSEQNKSEQAPAPAATPAPPSDQGNSQQAAPDQNKSDASPQPAPAPADQGSTTASPTPGEQSSGHQAPAGEPGTGETQTEQQSGSSQPAQGPQAGSPQSPAPAANSGPAAGGQ